MGDWASAWAREGSVCRVIGQTNKQDEILTKRYHILKAWLNINCVCSLVYYLNQNILGYFVFFLIWKKLMYEPLLQALLYTSRGTLDTIHICIKTMILYMTKFILKLLNAVTLSMCVTL